MPLPSILSRRDAMKTPLMLALSLTQIGPFYSRGLIRLETYFNLVLSGGQLSVKVRVADGRNCLGCILSATKYSEPVDTKLADTQIRVFAAGALHGPWAASAS